MHVSIHLLQNEGYPLTERWGHNLPCSLNAHCSLFLLPVPLDPEKVLEELKEKKDKLEEVRGFPMDIPQGG